jgi:hypothetical protein
VCPPPGEVNFYLNGVGAGNLLEGVYTSPYSAVINPTNIFADGTFSGGTSLPVICDDFASNVYFNEDWNAIVTNLSSLNSGVNTQVRWSSSTVTVDDTSQVGDLPMPNTCGVSANQTCAVNTGLTQVQAYDAAALLAIDISNIPDNTADQTALDDYSYAMWALFDTSGNGALNDPGALGLLDNEGDYADESQAITYLNAVVTEVTTDSTAVSNELSNFNINIYSYDGVTSPTCYPPQETPGPATCPSPFVPAQEFMTVTAVPEASPLAEYALYFLLGWGSVLLFRRRQISRADS